MTDHIEKSASATEQDGAPSPDVGQSRELGNTRIPKGLRLKGRAEIAAVLASSPLDYLASIEEKALRMKRNITPPDHTLLPSQLHLDSDERTVLKRIELLALQHIQRVPKPRN